MDLFDGKAFNIQLPKRLKRTQPSRAQDWIGKLILERNIQGKTLTVLPSVLNYLKKGLIFLFLLFFCTDAKDTY